MKFTITEKKIQVSDELKQYAERKITKIDRFFRGDAEAFVTFSSERGRFIAEVTIENNGTFYRVSEITSDMHASIDSACASIERQIRKNKTRLEKRLREGAFEMEPDPSYLAEPEEDDFKIIRNKHFPLKPMTIEEAILQMNLLEHTFFAFKNQDEDNTFAVVYRRKNGG
ncbi:MAG: ribosome-associated translation inhibitor RaiA, partial [Oscillospiraceae bacterium]